jgi:hypothetical protein
LAFVGDPFVHDVFVSYSHGNRLLKQWSQGFAHQLEAELRAYPQFEDEISVFLDDHHRPAQGIDPLSSLTAQLCMEIERSAVLMILMSPQYLSSHWCRDERNWWCDQQHSPGLPLEGRIAIARISPTREPWPERLTDEQGKELVGFYFYDRDQPERPFAWPEPNDRSGDPFRVQLTKLASRIRMKLEDIKEKLDERRRAQAAASKLAAARGQSIYLHGRSEDATRWEDAAAQLRDGGFVVFPGEPDPVGVDLSRMERIRELRVNMLKECDALLLVAGDDGRAVDADLLVVGRHDRRSANKPLLPCAILDRTGGQLATPTRRSAARDSNVDWIDATREPWTPAVHAWLAAAARVEAAL